MARNGVWATDAEIISTTSALGSDIYIYSENGNQGMDWLKYPSFNLSDSTKHAIYLQNKSCDHFDVVLSVYYVLLPVMYILFCCIMFSLIYLVLNITCVLPEIKKKLTFL